MNFEFATVTCSLQSGQVRETTHSTALVFPTWCNSVNASVDRRDAGYHVAAVTRGIRFAGAILLSSIGILVR
jgi:hypothetical protein